MGVCLPEALPSIVTPTSAECIVEADITTAKFEEGDRHNLRKPARVYKHASANKTLWGSDIRAIGEAHVLRDSPLFVEGAVGILERAAERVRVVGYARAEAGGALHRIRGWIEKEAVT